MAPDSNADATRTTFTEPDLGSTPHFSKGRNRITHFFISDAHTKALGGLFFALVVGGGGQRTV